jgi:hypothetical protein
MVGPDVATAIANLSSARTRGDSGRSVSADRTTKRFRDKAHAKLPSEASVSIEDTVGRKGRSMLDRVLGRGGEHRRMASSMAGLIISPPIVNMDPTVEQTSPDTSPRRLRRPASLDLSTGITDDDTSLPPTTNTLSNSVRADMLRRNRKLFKVLGETPSGLLPPSVPTRSSKSFDLPRSESSSFISNRASSSDDISLKPYSSTSTVNLSLKNSTHSRTHSVSDGRVTPNTGTSQQFIIPISTSRGRSASSPSASSFMDSSSPSTAVPQSPVTPSTPNRPRLTAAQKRAKLAKLHRYLGSCVPQHLALGLEHDSQADDLPPVEPVLGEDISSPKMKKKRDRGAEVEETQTTHDLNQGISQMLTDSERAELVRRKRRVERVSCEPCARIEVFF